MVAAAAPNPVRGHVPITSVDEKPRGEGGVCSRELLREEVEWWRKKRRWRRPSLFIVAR
jgi:hypothetical protein